MAEKHRPLRLFTESDRKGSSLRQSEASDAIKVLEKTVFFWCKQIAPPNLGIAAFLV